MSTVSCSAVLAASVEKVWRVLGDFGGWHTFIPRISATELEGGQGRGPVGAVRVLSLKPDGTARERLVRYDEASRALAYGFDGPIPFPVRSYLGTVQVWPVTQGGGSFIFWSGEFDCDAEVLDKVSEIFERTYTTFLGNLADHLESARS
jgi:hypothetical protein